MQQRNTINRNWLGIVALLVLALLLGLRSKNVATKILAAEAGDTDAAVAAVAETNDVAVVIARDSLLAALNVSDRNPFAKPVVKKKPKHRSRHHRTTHRREKIQTPELLTLLFDSVKPCIQISVAGNRSGWLHAGDEFKGWRVDDIAANTVAVSHGKRREVLR